MKRLRWRSLAITTVLSVSAIALTGCDDNIDGFLSVDSPISMRDKKGSSFTISSSRKLNIDPEDVGDIGSEELKLKLKDNAGKERKIEMKIPGSQRLPERNGSIFLRGSDVGQPFDLQADLATEESDGPQFRGTQSCSYTDYEMVCRDVQVTDWDGTVRWEQRCDYQQVQKTGEQEVVQHSHRVEVTAHAAFFAPGSSTPSGTFQGVRKYSNTVTDWEGPCNARWGW